MRYWPFSLFSFLFFFPLSAAASSYGIVDALTLAPFVPLVLDAMMSVAMAGYEFFVGGGTGIIYLLVWGWLAFSICLYLVKLYFPNNWLQFFGMSGKDQMWQGTIGGMKIGEDILKPCLRAIIAVTILLQVRPQYITGFIVEPFLRFGAIYTESISREVVQSNALFGTAKIPSCPEDIISKGYLSEQACDFLIKPIAQVTHANNVVIKRGLQFFMTGLRQLITIIPAVLGDGFLNLATGAILVITFVSSNFFMALLIIQGIFMFGMALILYPFKVLLYVVRDSDDWVNPWPAFEDIVKSLKNLVITMIACMFIMIVNIAAIKALFNWNNSVFMVAAGGAAHSNVPTPGATAAMGFGQHSVTILSALLTFYLMFQIFDLTKQQLRKYNQISKPEELYDKATADAKHMWGKTKTAGKAVGNMAEKTSATVKKIRGWFR